MQVRLSLMVCILYPWMEYKRPAWSSDISGWDTNARSTRIWSYRSGPVSLTVC